MAIERSTSDISSKAAKPKAVGQKDDARKQREQIQSLPTAVKNAKGFVNTGGFPVSLHVYDLGPVSKWAINSWAATGVYHCGVEVLGIEFSFQAMADCGADDDTSGLTWHHPKSHPRHVYRQSVALGLSPLCVFEIGGLLERLEKAWPARTYNCLRNNCTDFAACLVAGLRAPEAFPTWVHGLAKAITANPALGSADVGACLPMCCSSMASCTSCGSLSSSIGAGSAAQALVGAAGKKILSESGAKLEAFSDEDDFGQPRQTRMPAKPRISSR